MSAPDDAPPMVPLRVRSDGTLRAAAAERCGGSCGRRGRRVLRAAALLVLLSQAGVSAALVFFSTQLQQYFLVFFGFCYGLFSAFGMAAVLRRRRLYYGIYYTANIVSFLVLLIVMVVIGTLITATGQLIFALTVGLIPITVLGVILTVKLRRIELDSRFLVAPTLIGGRVFAMAIVVDEDGVPHEPDEVPGLSARSLSQIRRSVPAAAAPSPVRAAPASPGSAAESPLSPLRDTVSPRSLFEECGEVVPSPIHSAYLSRSLRGAVRPLPAVSSPARLFLASAALSAASEQQRRWREEEAAEDADDAEGAAAAPSDHDDNDDAGDTESAGAAATGRRAAWAELADGGDDMARALRTTSLDSASSAGAGRAASQDELPNVPSSPGSGAAGGRRRASRRLFSDMDAESAAAAAVVSGDSYGGAADTLPRSSWREPGLPHTARRAFAELHGAGGDGGSGAGARATLGALRERAFGAMPPQPIMPVALKGEPSYGQPVKTLQYDEGLYVVD